MSTLVARARLTGRYAALAASRPAEFRDRLAGRRERLAMAPPPDLGAAVLDPVDVGHALTHHDGRDDCTAEVAALRARVAARLSGEHHHDGGGALAALLWVLVRHARPRVVVETGVARGVSSAFVLDAMARNGHGHLWSIDLPPMTADWQGQTGVAVDDAVRDRWTYVRGSARRHLPRVLARTGPLDLFVHDGLHTADNVGFELTTAWRALRPGGLALVDDADDNDAVLRFAASAGVAPTYLREPDRPDVVAALRA